MDERLEQLTEKSIELELLMSDLYLIFHEIFPEDAAFWWQLVEEERNHASLIRSAREYFEPVHLFPEKLISDNLPQLKASNEHLRNLLDTYSKKPPQRAEAFNCALTLETTAGELHYQNFLDDTGHSKVEKIFRQLNGDDREHAGRIRTYMGKNNIPIQTLNKTL